MRTMYGYRVAHAVYETVTRGGDPTYIGFIIDGGRLPCRFLTVEEAGVFAYNNGGLPGFKVDIVPSAYPYYLNVTSGLLPENGVSKLESIAIDYKQLRGIQASSDAKALLNRLP